ncbi:hypothetical protein [Orientia tsutsugamushi]|uniref:hypothetical protein n=1 Tax=Orientia tsutsugamushi TaxID=784 RepID=UPI000D5A4DAB|nr:conjugal transfer protein TraE [Orientia tsutsugamushi]
MMKGLFATSQNEVARQITDMKVVFSNTESLNRPLSKLVKVVQNYKCQRSS